MPKTVTGIDIGSRTNKALVMRFLAEFKYQKINDALYLRP